MKALEILTYMKASLNDEEVSEKFEGMNENELETYLDEAISELEALQQAKSCEWNYDDFRKGVRACFDCIQTMACNTDDEEKSNFLYELSDDLLQNISPNDYNHWKNLKEALQSRSCDGCVRQAEDMVDPHCAFCSRACKDNFEPKEK